MEEEHILSADQIASNEDQPKNSSGVNKALLGIVIVLLLVITGGGAFYFGTRKSGDDGNATPTQPQVQTETLGQESEEPLETQEATEEAEVAGTETSDITPSVTPKVTAGPTLKIINPNNLKTFKLLPTSTPTPTPTEGLKIYVPPKNLNFQ